MANKLKSVYMPNSYIFGEAISVNIDVAISVNIGVAISVNIGVAISVNIGVAISVNIGVAISVNIGVAISVNIGVGEWLTIHQIHQFFPCQNFPMYDTCII